MRTLRARPLSDFLVAVLAILVAAGAAVVLVEGSETLHWAVLIGLVAVACITPIAIRAFQGRFDPFEPIMILSAGVFVLFVLRPIWMWANGAWTIIQYDARDGFTGALAIAALGMAGMVAGYFLPVAGRIAGRLPTLRDDWDPGRVRRAAGFVAIAAVILFTFHISTKGFGAITSYFSGRSAADYRLQESAGGSRISSSYFALAPQMMVPVTLVLLEVWRRERSLLSAAIAFMSTALVLTLTIPRGDRTFILALVLPLIAVPYLLRGRRPRVIGIIGAIIGTILISNVLAEFRRQETRQQSLPTATAQAFQHPLRQVDDFMLGIDVSMVYFLSAEYDALPERIDFKPAQGIAALVALPIPGLLWDGKPQEPAKLVYDELYPVLTTNTRAGFAVSVFGSFFADSSFLGVLLYSLFYGVIFRTLFEYTRQRPTNRSVCIAYAACLPLIIMMLRTSPSLALGGVVILVVPLVLIFWWGSRGVRVSRPGRGAVRAATTAAR